MKFLHILTPAALAISLTHTSVPRWLVKRSPDPTSTAITNVEYTPNDSSNVDDMMSIKCISDEATSIPSAKRQRTIPLCILQSIS